MSGEADWKWVRKEALILLHDESLTLHGGLPGMRDEGLLDSALARAPNLALYSNPDSADLAACYAVGLARNHPFADGNKRTAFLALGLFLFANGIRLVATQLDATGVMRGVAAGEIDETMLAAWLRPRLQPRAAPSRR